MRKGPSNGAERTKGTEKLYKTRRWRQLPKNHMQYVNSLIGRPEATQITRFIIEPSTVQFGPMFAMESLDDVFDEET